MPYTIGVPIILFALSFFSTIGAPVEVRHIVYIATIASGIAFGALIDILNSKDK